jgi:hypothetical protein
LGRIALHPAGDRGVIDLPSPFEHHFFQVAVVEARSGSATQWKTNAHLPSDSPKKSSQSSIC